MIIAFVGPSLHGARLPRGVEGRPPARQGDVWRALRARPSAIALIDGVFESVPSVWHHELLDALDAGVPVLGGASMGALRAAELHTRGMIGVGEIFAWYRDGVLEDDAAVALLHADESHGFAPFTVPHVNVMDAARRARSSRALRPDEAKALEEASARIFYQERTWDRVLEAARLSPAAAARWAKFARRGLPDLKARDAAAVLAAAKRVSPRPAVPREPRPSSLVRFRRLDGAAAPDALADQGLRRLLLAAQAREAGLRATTGEIAAQEESLRRRLRAGDRAALCARTGLDEAELLRACEDLALERLCLDHAARLVDDGPTRAEAAALEACLSGRPPRRS